MSYHIDDLTRNEDCVRDLQQMIRKYAPEYPIQKMKEYEYLQGKYGIRIEQLRGNVYRIHLHDYEV